MQLTLTNLIVILAVGAAAVLIVARLLAQATANKKDDRFGEHNNNTPHDPLGTRGCDYDPTKKSLRRFIDNVIYWFKMKFGD